jgi:phage tail P2-like protein
MSILPVNENAIARTLERLDAKHVNHEDITHVSLNPLTCDAVLLEHLALDLDVSIEGLDEDEARSYLYNAREIKRLKGSVWAVNKAAHSIFGNHIKIKTWKEANTQAGTFKLEIDVTPQKAVTDENINKTVRLIDEAKPVSRHLSGITLNMKSNGMYNYKALTRSDENLTVLPKVLKEVNIHVNEKVLVGIQSYERLRVAPRVLENIQNRVVQKMQVGIHGIETLIIKPIGV